MDKIEFETFRPITSWERGNLEAKGPSCGNGQVQVVKYRVTCERVEEPIEAIHERIQALWDRSTNHHDHTPLQAAAKRHGYVLQGPRGSKAVRR